jgi:hypothetical protein
MHGGARRWHQPASRVAGRKTARSSLNLGPDSADLELRQDLVYQPAVDPYAARAMLDALVERRRDSAEIGIVLVIGAALLAALGATRAAAPVLIGAAAGWFVCLCAHERRHTIIRLLVRQRSAYVLPEVARAGARLVTPEMRTAMAASLARLVLDPATMAMPAWPYILTRRIEPQAKQLLAISDLLVRESAVVHPSTMALLQRLLDQPTASPLYNPDVPEAHLAVLLGRVRAAIDESGAGRQSMSPCEAASLSGTERSMA